MDNSDFIIVMERSATTPALRHLCVFRRRPRNSRRSVEIIRVVFLSNEQLRFRVSKYLNHCRYNYRCIKNQQKVNCQ